MFKDEEEDFKDTYEHDQGGRNGLECFVTPQPVFENKEALLVNRKNRFIIHNSKAVK